MRYVFLCLSGFLLGCRPSAPQTPTLLQPNQVSVQVVKVELVRRPNLVPVTGLVKAARQGEVSAQVMGNVVELPVALGAHVAEGELLVRLASIELESRLAQARAAMNEADRLYRVEVSLDTKGATTKEAVANAQDRLNGAKANLGAMQAVVDQLTLKAPFAGVVTRKRVDVGDLAMPGRVLIEVQSEGKLEVETAIATTFPLLVVGTEVAYDFNNQMGTLKVKEISAAADVQSGRRQVLLAVEKGDLTPGMMVTVFWPTEERQRLLIPFSACQRHGQLERVWVVNEAQKLEMRLVRVAGAENNKWEVLSGLTGQEKVVVMPTDDFVEGMPVHLR
jgi:membrane fusion protein, multidrug efflux system